MDTGEYFRVMEIFSNWIVIDLVNSKSLPKVAEFLKIGEFYVV